ncbi:MAG: DUF4982 domain-containing protein [Thermoguttaceae bacterium]|nr:DUF4982 domain-containing protein [Thermoguttaceae bacterium]
MRSRVFALFIALAVSLTVFLTTAAGRGEEFPFSDGWRFRAGDAPLAKGKLFENILTRRMAQTTGTDLSAAPYKKWVGGPNPNGIPWAQSSFDDSDWETLDLPHDWAIAAERSQNASPPDSYLPCPGVGWYRKSFDVDASDAGKRFYLDFDGVMSMAAVWVNGRFAGGWPYGYTSFRVDATPFRQFGEKNTVAVRAAHPEQTSRWYTGAGIYRNVHLVKKGMIALAHWQSAAGYTLGEGTATVTVTTKIDSRQKEGKTVILGAVVYKRGALGNRPGEALAVRSDTVELQEGLTPAAVEGIVLSDPLLWSPEAPEMYEVELSISAPDGALIDSEILPLGFRTVEFTPDRGLLVKGKWTKLRGFCLHLDVGALGAAVNVRAMERQLDALKEAGCNAIRLSHNPAAPEMMDLLDRKGFLVQAEAFDQWTIIDGFWRSSGYRDLFEDWAERDLRALVRRDRNHPSVVMWSIGNEIPELRRAPERFIELGGRLRDIVHEEDPTRPVTSACNHRPSGMNGEQNVLDLFGYNYFGRVPSKDFPSAYEEFRAKNPEMAVYGSETTCTIATRGYYSMRSPKKWLENFTDYCFCSRGFQAISWNAARPLYGWAAPPDTELEIQEKYPWVCGEYIWTGIDYLGAIYALDEMTGAVTFSDPALAQEAQEQIAERGRKICPTHSCETGILDTACLKKDTFWLYRAAWRPEEPTAHLLPHWNWAGHEGETVEVDLFTNGEEAELFLNDQSLGRQKRREHHYRLSWDVPYRAGKLAAKIYRGGELWAEDTVETTGEAARVALSADRETIAADGKDLAFIVCEIQDAEGRVVPTADNHVCFTVAGPGKLVATDNGNARDWTSYASPRRAAMAGKLVAIVRLDRGASEPIRVTAQADDLAPAEITISPKEQTFEKP